MRGIIVALFAVVLFGSNATSQSLEPGARIRVASTALGPSVRTGVVVSSDADSLVLRADRSQFDTRLARSEVSSVEVSIGRHRNPGRGAMIGLLAGVAGGGIAGAVTWAPCTSWCILQPATRGASAALGAGVFGTLGAAIGAIAGALTLTDEWRSVSLVPGVSFSSAGAEAVGLRLSKSF